MKVLKSIVVERTEAEAVVNVPDRVPVYMNFQGLPVGEAFIRREGRKIVADISVTDEIREKIEKMYPAIGGVRSNSSVSISSIGICSGANVDPNVRKIEDQIYE